MSPTAPPVPTAARQQLVRMSLWFVVTLLGLELGLLAAGSWTERAVEGSAEGPGPRWHTELTRGRSVEAKLRRLVADHDAQAHPVAKAGWLTGPTAPPNRRTSAAGKFRITVYGMSFSNHISDQLQALDDRFEIRTVAGPAAPPNFGFAAFELDRGRDDADVVVWGLLASSLKGMYGITGQTTGFEQPAPFTYPRYDVIDGRLRSVQPYVKNLGELRQALRDPARLRRWRTQLKRHDALYSELLFRDHWLDRSFLLGLVRRAWARRRIERLTASYLGPAGIDPASLPGRVLPVLVDHFARAVRDETRVPVLLLIHDRGQSDVLWSLLKSTIDALQLPHLSTHTWVPAHDGSQFLADGHFTAEANRRLAERLRDLILAQLAREGQ